MATMKLEIVTAERPLLTDEVELVVAPGTEGELGILPHHAPLLTALAPGELRIRKGGQEQFIAISGGFMEVFGNKVTILADAAERAEEIDEERAQAAMRRARERLVGRTQEIDLQRALGSLRRAEIRVRVARRRRERGGVPPPM
ncbi:MAG: F0F1 ATP synthase subunit epsilon [Dehalococcoidia bacterium]|nr:F0F1 ATP synthase subunit epsilon [Dehalococcoidia bacterium]